MNSNIKLSLVVLLLLFLNACSTLQMAWKISPDPRKKTVIEGKRIVFELAPNTKDSFTLHFGDRSKPISVPRSEIKCSSYDICKVFKAHTYRNAGVFRPYVNYGNKRLPEKTDDIKLSIRKRNMKWKMYPDPRKKTVIEGNRIVFELTPNTKNRFTLHFGDRSKPISVPSSEIKCSSYGICKVLKAHTYRDSGSFRPYVNYGGKRLPKKTDDIKLPIGKRKMKWKMYPDPRKTMVIEGNRIVFELTPNTKNRFTLHFGDRSKPISVPSSEIKCSSYGICKVFKAHTYLNSGAYHPYVLYGKKKLPEYADKVKIIIVRKEALTDEQLKNQAREQVLGKIVPELQKKIRPCGNKRVCRSKLAVSVLEDANFKYSKGEEANVDRKAVKDVIEKLVNSGYQVVERHPQALIQLAHESIIKVDFKDKKKADAPYLDYLEYSVITSHEGPDKPFVYDAKLAGIEDVITEKERKVTGAAEAAHTAKDSKASEKSDEKQQVGIPEPTNTERQDKSSTKETEQREEADIKQDSMIEEKEKTRKRSSLFARFDAANYLLLLNTTKDFVVTTTTPHYSFHYKAPIPKRTVSVKMNVRLLNRRGNIVWMKDIKGEVSDTSKTVMPLFKRTKTVNHQPSTNDKVSSSGTNGSK